VTKHAIPVVHFESGQRKDDIVAGYRVRFSKQEGVVVLGIAQEIHNAQPNQHFNHGQVTVR